MKTSQNPFKSMLLTFNPDRIYGRANEITGILQVITSPEPNGHAIYGIRTIGKTTLLKYLKDKNGAILDYQDYINVDYRPGGSRRLIFVYLNFHNFSEDGRLFTIMVEQLRYELDDDYLGHEIHIPHLDDDHTRQDIVHILRSVLMKLDGIGVRVVFLLDDFDVPLDYVDEDDDRLLRMLNDYAALIIATEEPISELRPDIGSSSPLLGILRPEAISLLGERAARELMIDSLKETGVEFSDNEQDMLIKIAGLQPFLLIAACELYFDLKSEYPDIFNEESIKSNLETQFVYQLAGLPHVDNVLTRMWKLLSDTEKTALYNMAQTNEMMIERGGVAIRLAQKSLVWLDVRQGRYRVFSNLFEGYVRQHYAGPSEYDTQSIPIYITEFANHMSPIDQSVFKYLLKHANEVCTFDDLLEAVWQDGDDKSKRALEASVYRLRRQLGVKGKIKNIRGKGYKFVPGETTRSR